VFVDVDGVLTDGSLFYGAHGEEIKRFHVRDGAGMKMLQAAGVHVIMISGKDSVALRSRAKDLAIERSEFGVADKEEACTRIIQALGTHSDRCAFVGDDTIDLGGFRACGLALTVADAPSYIKRQADLVLKQPGGGGAFRELSDLILLVKGLSAVYQTHKGYLEQIDNMGQ
tara:strand:- start:29104 stop:29616 length:513 start_codon:yes stop_codon:yes gene_type:complete